MAKKINLPYNGQLGWGPALNAFLMEVYGEVNNLSQKFTNLSNTYSSGIYNGTGFMSGNIVNFVVKANGVAISEKYNSGVYDLGVVDNFYLELQANIFIDGTKKIVINNIENGPEYASKTVDLNSTIDLTTIGNNSVCGVFLLLNNENTSALFTTVLSSDYDNKITNSLYCQVGLIYKDNSGVVYFKTKFSNSGKNAFTDLYQTKHPYAGNELVFDSQSCEIANTNLSYTNSGIQVKSGEYLDYTNIDTLTFDYTSTGITYNYYKIDITNPDKILISTKAEVESLVESGNVFAAYLDVFGFINIFVDTQVTFKDYKNNAIQQLTFLTPEIKTQKILRP